HLAQVFEIPPALFGLADPDSAPTTRRIRSADRVPERGSQKGGDHPVRRRELLAGLATAPLAATAPATVPRPPVEQPAATLATSLEDVPLRPPPPHPHPNDAESPIPVLRQRLVDVRTDFQTSRYRTLASKLPRLVALAQARATADPHIQAVLAEIYNTVA